MFLGLPCMCINITLNFNLETTSEAAGSSVKALISLTIFAPASKAASITFELQVSTEIVIPFFAKVLMTGITRFICSLIETGLDPGRLDSPPISNISAP